MDISENIKKIREAKRISQSELARKLNIEPTNYPRIEKRGNGLTIKQLQSIAGALGVSVGELLGGEAKAEKNNEIVEKLEARITELQERVVEQKFIIDHHKQVINTINFEADKLVSDLFHDLDREIVKAAMRMGLLEAEDSKLFVKYNYDEHGNIVSWDFFKEKPYYLYSLDFIDRIRLEAIFEFGEVGAICNIFYSLCEWAETPFMPAENLYKWYNLFIQFPLPYAYEFVGFGWATARDMIKYDLERKKQVNPKIIKNVPLGREGVEKEKNNEL